jgi:type IV pilus assembly protein PilX
MITNIYPQYCRSQFGSPIRQRGITLVIALIFLLVLTLLGVTAMQSTVVEERIAGNTRDKDVAFQSAEAGLRAGETLLTGVGGLAPNVCTAPGMVFGAAPNAGLINNVGGGAGVQYASTAYWLAQLWDATDSRATSAAMTGAQAAARYVIEYVAGPGSTTITQPSGTVMMFRVTAKGGGVTPGSISILQTNFKVVCP